MKINYAEKNFISEVEVFNQKILQRKADITGLIGLVISNNKEKDFEELTFTAKYICGMMRVLKTAPSVPEVQSTAHIKEDLSDNLKKIINQLRGIIISGDNAMQDHFEKTYLTLSSQNLINLNQLLADLECIKKYINHLKRID